MRRKTVVWALMISMVAGCLAGCNGEQTESTSIENSYKYTAPEGIEQAGIFVEPVEGISDEFIRGVDISSVLAEEKSGVKYYGFDGKEADLFMLLADAGVNLVRVRVWNDPYDENGNGYGGGNCDVACAAEIGRRAAEYNMKLMVDFHYSDFWADPGKQMVPKAWEGMTVEEKASAAYTFTLDAMNTILDAGADVSIVQLGNETNNAMSGETKWSAISKIVTEGRRAVLEAGEAHGNSDIKIALHFTNPENFDGIKGVCRKLESTGVRYDIFALSYYPYWHGTLENLTNVLNYIKDTYGKDTMIAETSYCYTVLDGDGTGNSVSEKDLNKNYAATVQSQVNAVRDVCDAAVKGNSLGVVYWEPAWIPVQAYYYDIPGSDVVLSGNKSKWEELGSGWASSYAGSYDPDDAGKWYGGSSWDNQAFFDFEGHALESLNVYKYLKYGSTSELKVDFASNISYNVNPGSALVMPETVEVHYNDRSKNGPAPITWNEEDKAKVDTNSVGEYDVRGTFEDGTEIICTVKVANVNWVKNPSFEDDDRSAWNFIYSGDSVLDFQQKETDSYTGEWAMHYWRNGAVEFKAEQTITDLQDGKYYLSAYIQGGDSGDNAEMYLYAVSGGKEYRADYQVKGWIDWQHPEISGIEVTGGEVTIGVAFKGGEGAWGTMDDFYFCLED